MKVAIITTREERYHRWLCAEIARHNEVVAVLHPQPRRARPLRQRLQRHRRALARRGWLPYLLEKLARNRVHSFGWSLADDVAAAERAYFPDADDAYDRLVARLAHVVPDVNAPEGIDLLRSFGADAVVCSGGPIYRRPLIEAAGRMLNFHTGISPIYNGSWTIFWTFANGQPHLTGGTLMTMSPRVDGGDVLAHYLPEIEPGDTPGTQFMKTLRGGVGLYNRLLAHLREGRPFVAVSQPRHSFHYYRARDWTVQQTLAIERHVREGLCARHVRPEIAREYWNLEDAGVAHQEYERTLRRLLFGA